MVTDDLKKGNLNRLTPFIIFAIIFIPFASAGFFDTLDDLITGFQTSTFEVSVSVANFRPNITFVSNDTFGLIAGDFASVNISFIAEDTNGAGDLNTSTIIMNATFSDPGSSTEFTRNFTCVVASGQVGLTSNQRNYSCGSANFSFYDGSGSWNISVMIADNSSNFTTNLTQSFFISQTISINLTLTTLNFPSVAGGDENVTASNDPQTIQNIGNKDNISINLTGINLIGDSDSSGSAIRIDAVNFSVSYLNTAPSFECDYNRTATRLENNTAIPANVTIRKGADRTNDTYFCLLAVPGNILAQTYSTGGTPDEDDWTFTSG